MKRKGNIYEKIIELSNIEAAIYKASKGKGSRKSVEKILDSPTYYALQIQKSLKDKTYRPSPYVEMKIHDGANKKERIIYKPHFYPDQIVHWALMLQLEPLLMKGMYEFCCASIKGRGIMRGMRHIKKILVQDRKYTKYCLKLDIKKFYPSIDKQRLKDKFRRILKDKDTLNLIDLIIDSGIEGVPIGNFTSQWFANFYLQDLDHFIKEQLKVKYYVRYMDDMVLFSNNKKELRKIKIEIDNFLSKEKLTIKENWQLFKTESRPLDFLGYRFYRGYTTLRRSNFLRIKRRAKKISKKEQLTFHDAAAMLSYSGWLKHCNSFNYQQKYIKPYVNYKLCKEVIRNESKKTESTIRPLNFRIGDHKGNLIEVVFFDDIEEVKRTSEDGSEQTVYLYYEYTINIVNRNDLESYINDNYETWLQMAKDSFIASKSAEIRAIRDKLLSDSDKQVLIDRLGIEIPETINTATMLNVIKDLFSSLGNILNGDWSKYRQELRDITKQPNFPYDVEFPKLPGDINE